MTPLLVHWHITPDATHDGAYAILSQDPVWNCFALADLEPPLRAYSHFALASQEESTERAICLILRHPIIGEVLSPFGNRQGVAAILKHLTLPERPLIQAQDLHLPLLERYYYPETTWKRMLRMAITSTSWRPLATVPSRSVKQLTVSDLPALKHLYAQHPESGFSADLFPQGLYFGAYAGERIVAAGGTHALVPTHGIAVLGNILTAPEARGQGYATAITTSLVATLFDQHFSLVVLNVFEDNSPAIRIYQRLGFQTHHRLLTGKASRSPRREGGKDCYARFSSPHL
jgi:RimJ/RimL family protein N-acetyltransferase